MHADPNAIAKPKNGGEKKPLDFAAENQSGHDAKLLCESIVGFDGGTSMLIWAVENHNIDFCRLLLNAGDDPNQADAESKTALHRAAEQALPACANEASEAALGTICRLLIEFGADVRFKDGLGNTALHVSVSNSSREVCSALVFDGSPLTRDREQQRMDLLRIMNHDGFTPLHIAACRENASMCAFLLRMRADIETRDARGNSPLHLVAMPCNPELATLLLDNKAKPNARGPKGKTALHLACEPLPSVVRSSKLEAFCRVLIERQASVLARDRANRSVIDVAGEVRSGSTAYNLINTWSDVHGRFPLHRAIEKGDEKLCIFLSEHPAVNFEATDSTGRTPLHVAAEVDDNRARYRLCTQVAKRCSLLVQCTHQQTALHVSAKRGDVDTCKLFLNLEIEKPNRRGYRDPSKVMDLLLAQDDLKQTALHVAASFGHHLVTALLIEVFQQSIAEMKDRGVDVSKYLGVDLAILDSLGHSPLHRALSESHSQVCRTIVEARASLCSKGAGDASYTPLSFAKRLNSPLFRKLRDGWPESSVQPPVFRAAAEGDHKLVNELLGHTADIWIFDESKMTPLHVAAEKGHSEVCKLFVENKRSEEDLIIASGLGGKTPLHLAAAHAYAGESFKEYRKICRLLAAEGATLRAQDVRGNTAFDEGKENLLQVLTTGKQRLYPLHAAVKNGDIPLVKLLVTTKVDLTEKFEERTALQMATDFKFMDIGQFLSDAMTPPLHRAAELNDIKRCKSLVREGHDLRGKNSRNEIPLHVAARSGHAEMCACLHDLWKRQCTFYGHLWDLQDRDDEQQTALDLAAKGKHEVAFKRLIELGAVPTGVDHFVEIHPSTGDVSREGDTSSMATRLKERRRAVTWGGKNESQQKNRKRRTNADYA
eukprot:TRINITY_DN1515_c0_g1_i6.p1 TRINITY_DN1515_c0_g1~~TRINITY_DN1515_c0_g1_i6.p1  ORF type:complete len:898 (-),score=126.70 TRINITY_DN1515_c0_g1_i6:143-2794(-)